MSVAQSPAVDAAAPSLVPIMSSELASPSGNEAHGRISVDGATNSQAEPQQQQQHQLVTVASATQQSSNQMSPVPLTSPSGGWVAPTNAADSALAPAGSGVEGAAAAAGGSVPSSVSEQSQEAAKEEAAAAELKDAGFFKQTLSKVRTNLCGPLHVGDALFVAWIIFWFIVTGTTKGGVKWLWLIIALCSYCWYLSWNWKSNERRFIWSMMDVPHFESYWKGLRAATPTISMQTESWHWQRRTHTTTTYNANGGSSTTTTVTYVRTVTHTELMSFAFRTCVDHSLDVLGSDLEKNNATFVHLWKEYSFADASTALTYYNQLTALKARNQNKDKNMDTTEWMTIPGWQQLVGVYRDAASRPALLRNWIFALACIFLLSWPMKIYCEWAAKKGGFTMKKQVAL